MERGEGRVNYLIIYKKQDNSVIYRTTKHIPNYKINDTTSMGWLVLDIKKMQKGKLYSFSEYDTLMINRMKFNDLTTLLYKIDIFKLLELSLIGVIMYMLIVK